MKQQQGEYVTTNNSSHPLFQEALKPKWNKYMFDSDNTIQINPKKFEIENNFTFNKNMQREGISDQYDSQATDATCENYDGFETIDVKLSDLISISNIISPGYFQNEDQQINNKAQDYQINTKGSEENKRYMNQIQQLEFQQWSVNVSNMKNTKDTYEETTPYISVKILGVMSDYTSNENPESEITSVQEKQDAIKSSQFLSEQQAFQVLDLSSSQVDSSTEYVMENQQEDLETLLHQAASKQLTSAPKSPQKQFENEEDQQELQQVYESISYGKSFSHKRLSFQAFSAALSHQEQVRFVISYLSNVSNTIHQKFPSAKNKILAYRVNQTDQIQQKDVMVEGFDDDGETGAGEKLLGLLQKMEIENILIIVCVWNNGAQIGTQQVKGGELFKIIIERARDLLTSIHDQIMQNELEHKKQMDQEQSFTNQGKRQALGAKVFQLGAAQDSKIRGNSPFKTSQIIGTKRNRSPQVKNDQESYFLGQAGSNEGSDGEDNKAQPDQIEDQIIKNFPDELTYEDYEEANKEVEESLRQLTKASLMELKQFSKPHQLVHIPILVILFQVEKSLNIVCALRGFRNFNWNTAKELIAKPHFKVELLQMKPRTLRPQDVLKAQQILNAKTNVALTPQNVHLHSEAAALLLVWSANLIKQYACTKKFGEINEGSQIQTLKAEDVQKIQAKTSYIVQKEQQLKKQQEANDYHRALLAKHEQMNHQDQSRQQMASQKSPTIGHFVQNKQMVFNMEGNALAPENKGEKPTLVDISIIKKAGHLSTQNKSKPGMSGGLLEFSKQDECMFYSQIIPYIAKSTQYDPQQYNPNNTGGGNFLSIGGKVQAQKNAQQQPVSKSIGAAKRSMNNSKVIGGENSGRRGSSQVNQNSSNIDNGGESSQQNSNDDDAYLTDDQQALDEVPGKLKMHEVRELQDDVDSIIGKLKGVDYGVQDLDVLIELAKQLKHKRLALFPDTANILLSENFGSYNATNANIAEEDHKK